ncbi:MAG: hypothetical protein RKO25_01855 [Candidatus Contendobacter sp.]|nr:hypothetical protein [Candidatus Contendobacter sp.]
MSNSDYEPLSHLKCHAHILKEGLLQRIDELSVSDYPAKTPSQIIGFLRDFLASLSEVIEKSVSEERLKTLSSLIQKLGIFLEWLDNAHTEQTPRGLVKLLENIIDHMYQNSQFIACPQAQYNYTISDLGDYMNRLVEAYIPHSKQKDLQEYLSSPIKLISFPRIERDNMLSHAIFGHELGHPIASDYLEAESKDDRYQETCKRLQQQVSEFVNEELKKSTVTVSNSDKLKYTTQLFEKILRIRERALEELVSDAVGIFIFGPSAFFACFELFLSSNLDAEPTSDEFYPPPRMRIRLMLDLMEKDGFNNQFSQLENNQAIASYVKTTRMFLENAKQLSAVKKDQDKIENDPTLRIAYNSMEASLPEAYNFAKKETEKVSFNSGVIFSQLPELVRRLEFSIPPNEVGDPSNPQTVDYRATLLASWMFKLHGFSSNSRNPLSNAEINQLHKLTLCAIEYVILQDDYKRHMEGNA